MTDHMICEIPDCGNKQYRKGPLCRTHTAEKNSWKKCAVDGCGGFVNAHGYCGKHAYKFRVHGDPLGGRRGASPGAPLKWIRDHAGYQGDDCIKWPFEIANHGYGTVKHNGKKRVASRVMCEFAHGLPPDSSMDAAHSCGNGQHACMNPNHLRWATRKENMADSIKLGRWMHGERVVFSKLNRHQVLEIRSLKGKMTHGQISEKFGICKTQVWRIMNRYDWAWLDG